MTVAEIFETMEYGPAPESAEPAEAWLAARGGEILPFIGGKLEQLMLVNLIDLWRGEGEVTADWLEKNA